MFNWLRRAFGKSRPDALESVLRDRVIDVWLDDQWCPCHVVGASGLHLMCSSKMSSGRQRTFLVAHTDARDKHSFWALWRLFNQGVTFQWENGDPFDPTEIMD